MAKSGNFLAPSRKQPLLSLVLLETFILFNDMLNHNDVI